MYGYDVLYFIGLLWDKSPMGPIVKDVYHDVYVLLLYTGIDYCAIPYFIYHIII